MASSRKALEKRVPRAARSPRIPDKATFKSAVDKVQGLTRTARINKAKVEEEKAAEEVLVPRGKPAPKPKSGMVFTSHNFPLCCGVDTLRDWQSPENTKDFAGQPSRGFFLLTLKKDSEKLSKAKEDGFVVWLEAEEEVYLYLHHERTKKHFASEKGAK